MRAAPEHVEAWPVDTSDLYDLQTRLVGAATVRELFARTCAAALRVGGFDLAVVVTLENGCLTAASTGTIGDASSDALRRRIAAEPVAVTPGSAEAMLLSRPDLPRGEGRPSVLAGVIDAGEPTLVALAPREQTVALLAAATLDGSQPSRRSLEILASIAGLALEIVVGRLGLKALSSEATHMLTSVRAMLDEALHAPDILHVDAPSALNRIYPDQRLRGGPSALEGVFTGREQDVARLMVSGRSNREIAAVLHLSVDTVKSYVARVLRKLGVSNRVEAVRLYLELSGGMADHAQTVGADGMSPPVREAASPCG